MIFSKISLVTSHGAFSTRLDFTAGNTPCRQINQSTTSIHSVPCVLVFRTAQVENTRLKCSGDVSLGNECKNKLQTHTQESLYDTYFKHGIGWHTTQYGKGYCQRYDDFQGNDGHFIGYWLNIVTGTLVTLPESFPAFRTNARFIEVQLSLCYCSGSAGASVVAHSVALPHIEIAFSTLDCSIVPTCGAWGSATAAQTWTLETVLGGNTALTRWWTARSIDADAKR